MNDREFKCPLCGGFTFGTARDGAAVPIGLVNDDEVLADFEAHAIGYCHGDGCKFTWRRTPEADALVFTGKKVDRPSTVVGKIPR